LKDLFLSNEKMRFSDKDLIIYEKNNLVLIYSKKNKKHIFHSREVYEYILEAIKEGLTYKNFIDLFSENDKEYIAQLLNDMINLEALCMDKNIITPNSKSNISEVETIYFSITHRCNLECLHCCTSCNIHEHDILTTKDILSTIDYIITLNPRELILTGGEPLIREDFREIVEYINKNANDLDLVLSTNGTLINDNNINLIVNNFSRVEISIDGVDEETCSKVRGKGIFKKIISKIYKLQDNNFYNIRTSMIFGDKNEHLIDKFEKLNSDLGTQALPRCFEPSGRGEDNVLDFLYEETILPLTLTKLDHIKNRNELNSCSCDLYEGRIFIDYDGKLYPCQSLMKDKYSLGNILFEETKEMLRNYNIKDSKVKQNIEAIYPYRYEKCKNCDVNILCMYCPALIDTVIDNEHEFNKWCGLMKPQLNRIIWNEEC
jgi:radical SAM protein with 4Fe4S-binding SPASM domain